MAGKLGIGDLAAMGLGNVGIGPLNVGNVLDTVDFVKKAWTSLGVPSGFTPTLDLDELDKRIADLKAVEQWLTLNMNMLQGTIQALEIQRGTIAALRAFGAPLEAAAPAAQAIAAALSRAAPAFDPAGTRPGESGAPAEPQSPGAHKAPATGTGKRARPTRRGQRGATAPAAASVADPGLSPGAWWNLLQSQFNQVAAAALSGVGRPGSESGKAGQREATPGARSGVRRARSRPSPSPAAAGGKPAARARKA